MIMPPRVTLTFYPAKPDGSGHQSEPENIQVEFSDEEWDVLCRFTGFAEELLETTMIKEGVGVRYNLKWEVAQGMRDDSSLPPQSYVAEFIHRMRPFVVESEPTHFYKVCKILGCQIEHERVRKSLGRLHDLYSGKELQRYFKMTTSDIVVNSQATLDMWLNAFEYHRDKEKRQRLTVVHSIVPEDNARAMFVSMMYDRAKAVIEVARLIRAIEKRDGAPIAIGVSDGNGEPGKDD